MTGVTNDHEHPARLRAGTGETIQENRTRFAFCHKKETLSFGEMQCQASLNSQSLLRESIPWA